MSAGPEIHDILDLWEQLKAESPEITPAQFLSKLAIADSSLIAREFSDAVRRLDAVDRCLEKVLPSSDGIEDFPSPILGTQSAVQGGSPDKGSLQSSHLRAGAEPIPGYRLNSRIGVGGFGEVWKAESSGGFHVALKFVPLAGLAVDSELRSLEAVKGRRHPHLLSLFGAWKIVDWLVIAMELADETLLERFNQARRGGLAGIPRTELMRYMREAAEGIDALNQPFDVAAMSIQHRDIKPQNLLLCGGSVKVGDFGLARSITRDATTHTGSMTLAYAAPECFDGVTSRFGDQYSLAITYCFLLTGKLPFEGTHFEVLQGHIQKPPDLTNLPPTDRDVVSRALAKRPGDRWRSCCEFISRMGDDGFDRRSESETTIRPPRLRNHLGIFVTSLVALAILGGFVWQRYLLEPKVEETLQSFDSAISQTDATHSEYDSYVPIIEGGISTPVKRDIDDFHSELVVATSVQDAVNSANDFIRDNVLRAESKNVASIAFHAGKTDGAVAVASAEFPNVVDPARAKAERRVATLQALESSRNEIGRLLLASSNRDRASGNPALDSFASMTHQSLGRLAKSYCVHDIKSDPRSRLVYVTVVVTNKHCDKLVRLTPTFYETQDLKLGLERVIADLGLGLLPSEGGIVLCVPTTQEIALVGFGSCVVDAADKRAEDSDATARSERLAKEKGIRSLCLLISQDTTTWLNEPRDVKPTDKIGGDNSRFVDIDGVSMDAISRAHDLFLNRTGNDEIFQNAANAIPPPSATTKTWLSAENDWANSLTVLVAQ